MTRAAVGEAITIGMVVTMMLVALFLTGRWLLFAGDRVDFAVALGLWANAGVVINHELCRP